MREEKHSNPTSEVRPSANQRPRKGVRTFSKSENTHTHNLTHPKSDIHITKDAGIMLIKETEPLISPLEKKAMAEASKLSNF